MGLLQILPIFLASVVSVHCYIYNITVPLEEGKCSYGSELKSKDETWYNPSFCESITCQIEEDKAYIVIVDCGVPAVPDPKCEVTVGKGDYPDCCPKITCYGNIDDNLLLRNPKLAP